MQAVAVTLASKCSPTVWKSHFFRWYVKNYMAFLSQNSFSSFSVFCAFTILGIAIIIVPAVMLVKGDHNETLVGIL